MIYAYDHRPKKEMAIEYIHFRNSMFIRIAVLFRGVPIPVRFHVKREIWDNLFLEKTIQIL